MNTLLLNFGRVQVSAGGRASNTIVSSGGGEFVNSGGTAIGTIVSSGGGAFLTVSASGLASSTTVLSGGNETVLGVDTGATVSGGMVVSSGGVVSNATITHGFINVSSGGILSGSVTLNGSNSNLTLNRNAVVSGGVVFAGPIVPSNFPTLQISGATIPTGLVVSGFTLNDAIILASVPFDSGGTTAILGSTTLEVTENGSSYDINFGGSLAGEHFAISSGFGGTTEILLDQITLSSGQSVSGLGLFKDTVTEASGASVCLDLILQRRLDRFLRRVRQRRYVRVRGDRNHLLWRHSFGQHPSVAASRMSWLAAPPPAPRFSSA